MGPKKAAGASPAGTGKKPGKNAKKEVKPQSNTIPLMFKKMFEKIKSPPAPSPRRGVDDDDVVCLTETRRPADSLSSSSAAVGTPSKPPALPPAAEKENFRTPTAPRKRGGGAGKSKPAERPKPSVPSETPPPSSPRTAVVAGVQDEDGGSRYSSASSSAFGTPPLLSRDPAAVEFSHSSGSSTCFSQPAIISRNPLDVPKSPQPTSFAGILSRQRKMTPTRTESPKTSRNRAETKITASSFETVSLSQPSSFRSPPPSSRTIAAAGKVRLSPSVRANVNRFSLSQELTQVFESDALERFASTSVAVAFSSSSQSPRSKFVTSIAVGVQSTSRRRVLARRRSSLASRPVVDSAKKVLDFSKDPTTSSPKPEARPEPEFDPKDKKRYRNDVGVYLRPFDFVLESVFSERNSGFVDGLFTDEELAVVGRFREAPLAPKKLYVRIFERKWVWHDPADVEYADVDDDLTPHFERLADLGLFLKGPKCDGTEESLTALLRELSADQVKDLRKSLNIGGENSKEKSVEALLRHCRNFKQSVFGGQRSTIDRIASKVVKLMGTRYKVDPDAAEIFKRVFVLYSPPDFYADTTEEASLVKAQLLRMRQVEWERLSYPPVRPMRTTRVFRDRDDFLACCRAHARREDMWRHFEAQEWDSAVGLIPETRTELSAVLRDEAATSFAVDLPGFLRRYCLGSVLCSTLTTGADALEKSKDYRGAVDVLRFLLGQGIYLGDYRGRWYDRLALNLQAHLKSNDEAVDALAEALRDPEVRFARRRSLQSRATTLLGKMFKLKMKEEEKKKKKSAKRGAAVAGRHAKRGRGGKSRPASSPSLSRKAGDFVDEGGGDGFDDDEREERSIREEMGVAQSEVGRKYLEWRRKLLHGDEPLLNGVPLWGVEAVACRRIEGVTGRKAVYQYDSFDGCGALVSNFCSVEEVAIEHYKGKGYENGIHGEGRIWGSMFGLLFWDVLYKPLPDAFLTEFQSAPADLNSDEFYARRRDDVDARLALVRDDLAAALDAAAAVWDGHKPRETQSLVAWSFFRDFDHFRGLAETLGAKVVAGVCERLAKFYRYTRSGLPDIVVWSTVEQKYVIAEVKGPGDTLSEKQELWLEYLTSKLQAVAVVCEIKDKKGSAAASPSANRGRKRAPRAGIPEGGSAQKRRRVAPSDAAAAAVPEESTAANSSSSSSSFFS